MLIGWAADTFSGDIKLRERAASVRTQLAAEYWIPVVCWHHFEELIRHSSEDVAESRIKFLLSLPFIAWVSRADRYENAIGSVVDVLAREINAFLSSDGISTKSNEFVNAVRACLLQFGRPTQLPMSSWRELRPDLIALGQREQEIASIQHTGEYKNDDALLSTLNSLVRRSPEEITHVCSIESVQLAHQLASKGDKRLGDTKELANLFYSDAVLPKIVGALLSEQPLLDAFICQFGFSPSDFSDCITLGDFSKAATRYNKLDISLRQLGIPIQDIWPKMKNVLLPSEEIISEIRISRRNALRASGSDLNDEYMASLAPYLDVVIVDKRTYEYIAQAKKRRPELTHFFKSIFKASEYHQIPVLIDSI